MFADINTQLPQNGIIARACEQGIALTPGERVLKIPSPGGLISSAHGWLRASLSTATLLFPLRGRKISL